MKEEGAEGSLFRVTTPPSACLANPEAETDVADSGKQSGPVSDCVSWLVMLSMVN